MRWAYDMMSIVWSPDGKYIYAIDPRDAHAIGRWDSSGKRFTSIPVRSVACDKESRAMGLACEKQPKQELSFNPSGKHAAIVSMGRNRYYIGDVRNHEIIARRTLPKGFVGVGQSAWLDETHLLFEGAKHNSVPFVLWKLDVDSDKLTKSGGRGVGLDSTFALAPDHHTVVVSALNIKDFARRGLHTSLWRYSLDSGSTQQLTQGTFDSSPSWRH